MNCIHTFFNPLKACSQQALPSHWRAVKGTASAMLVALATSIPAMASNEPTSKMPANSIYRSTESATHTPLQLGQALSIPELPDPALALTTTLPDDTATDLHPFVWYFQDAWITDIGLLLFHDADNDGHFAAFSLSIDADTTYSDTSVYLAIDLQRPFYPPESLHTSAIFPLYGQSPADEYRIEIELVRNYPADYYDLIIELRDAYDHRVLDRVTALDFSNLRSLPLESEEFDTDYHFPLEYPDDPYPPVFNDDISVTEHAGSLGWLMAAAMILLLRIRTRQDSRTGAP